MPWEVLKQIRVHSGIVEPGDIIPDSQITRDPSSLINTGAIRRVFDTPGPDEPPPPKRPHARTRQKGEAAARKKGAAKKGTKK